MYKKSPAICLKKTSYTQTDTLVTCFTAKYGKDDFLARGLRKPKAKLKSALFPLRGINLTFVAGKQFPVVTGANTKMEFTGLESNFDYHALGLFLAESVDLAFIEPEPHPKFFNDFLKSLQLLDSEAKKNKTVSQKTTAMSIWLLVDLLSTTGYEMQLNHCVACNKKVKTKGKHKFSPLKGGVVCNNCRENNEDRLSEEGRQYLIKLKKAKEPTLEPPSQNLLEELKEISLSFLYHQLDQRPSTHKLISWQNA